MAILLLPGALTTAHADAGTQAGQEFARFTKGRGVEAAFSTPLPLIILAIAPAPPSAGANAATAGELRVIDNATGENRPDDPPTLVETVVIRREGKPADGKVSYTCSLPEKSIPLLGMPSNDRWSLAGSNLDKGMLRRYLGSRLASALQEGNAPEVRYCEVLLEDEDGYSYQGLYLATEYTPDGVWLAPGGMAGKDCVFLFDPHARPGPGQTGGKVTILQAGGPDGFPVSEEQLRARMTRILERLNSTNAGEYFSALASLDLDSFVNAFLVHELMENHTEKMPFYYYLNRGGKIGISPRFSFESSLNNCIEPLEFPYRQRRGMPASGRDGHAGGDTAFTSGFDPRFEGILNSTRVVDHIRARYYSLVRKGLVGQARADAMLTRLQTDFGAAFHRDWQRWREEYVLDPRYALLPVRGEGGSEVLRRRTRDEQQEFLKLRRELWDRDLCVRDCLRHAYWRDGIFTKANDVGKNIPLSLLFVGLFLAIVRYSRRRMG